MVTFTLKVTCCETRPIALIDDNMPVIFIAPMDDVYEKVVSNIQEVKKGKLLGVVTDGDKEVAKLADYIIEIPRCMTLLLLLALSRFNY